MAVPRETKEVLARVNCFRAGRQRPGTHARSKQFLSETIKALVSEMEDRPLYNITPTHAVMPVLIGVPELRRQISAQELLFFLIGLAVIHVSDHFPDGFTVRSPLLFT